MPLPEHEFAIPVRDLDAGGRSFDFPIPHAWIRGALEGTQVQAAETDGALAVRLSKSGTDVVVHGSFRADLVVPCARCLAPAHVTVAEPLSVLAVPAAAVRESLGAGEGKGKGEDDDGDPAADGDDVIPYDGETVVLDDLVRDELLLGIPMIPLCSEQCPGMSPVPGQPPEAAEAAIDPRLRPLLRLKKMSQ